MKSEKGDTSGSVPRTAFCGKVSACWSKGGQIHEGLNRRQVMVTVAVNALLLAELTFAMYLGQHDPENLVMTFLCTFVPLVVGTLVLARVCLRRLATR